MNTVMIPPASQPAEQASQHLNPEVWAKVNRLLLRKALSEFAHERLLRPEAIDASEGRYRLGAPGQAIEYGFEARRMSLDHWQIDAASISKRINGQDAPLDALQFIIEFSAPLGIGQATMPLYLDEISSTLYGSAFKHGRHALSADELTRADFQSVETSMSEGHPSFIANNGRIGFDAVDYRAYAPEAGSPIRLVWLAVHRSQATFSSLSDLSYQQLMQEELGAATLAAFEQRLRALALDPDDYLLMPAHPWQWHNKLSIAFCADVARRHIVCLGYGEDAYRAQQSIRTLFNISRPEKRYVKTSLSILNMGFMRGLSPYYMLATPAINEWIKQRIDADPYLRANGFSILREVASIGFRNHYYESAIEQDSPYKKMFSALWRESPAPQLGPGQRLMTMAALLHLDNDGHAVLAALIRSSGLTPDDWVRRYLRAYLAPLLHCFYHHDMVFMPHGENLILVLEDNAPVRALMKDIAEETAILDANAALPEKISRLSVSVPEELKILSLFTDIFDGFFRYMAPILEEQAGYPEQGFWRAVADCVRDYQSGRPDLAEKFARHDLFAPRFTLSCLNRLQLANNQQMIDLADPAKNLKFAGTLVNPIAAFRQPD
ncbi:IucA/IucC family protein [Paludibacterium paludis]|uniref:Alcaligin biosynthesis protein n=1 Tax=Paludibacterium paludis TaxID=1225769 RepID=A0A918P4Y7_9NEIS|nr:IucA/IucC family siderophore biosynthesis protein [Paludibacterium paludis]GGY20160.1 alcaligin biosynthesis protein [Paludibacterium paludis]